MEIKELTSEEFKMFSSMFKPSSIFQTVQYAFTMDEEGCDSFFVGLTDNNVLKAAKELGINKIALAGGVSANSYIRGKFMELEKTHGFKVYYPEPILCTDNAAMIASAGYYNYINGKRSDLYLNAIPNLKLGEDWFFDILTTLWFMIIDNERRVMWNVNICDSRFTLVFWRG